MNKKDQYYFEWLQKNSHVMNDKDCWYLDVPHAMYSKYPALYKEDHEYFFDNRFNATTRSIAQDIATIKKGSALLRSECAMHECDNKDCVNPNHIVCGTQQQNLIDALKRNRRVLKGSVRKGRKHVKRGFWQNKENVDKLMYMLESGVSVQEAADFFNTSRCGIYCVCSTVNKKVQNV